MKKEKKNLRVLAGKLFAKLDFVKRYSVVIFVVFVAALYGFVMFQIASLNSQQPSQDAITAQVNAAQVPRIDQKLVDQLQSLQDNSVSVQTLFNEARSNPFQ
jgi:hypothetical protein